MPKIPEIHPVKNSISRIKLIIEVTFSKLEEVRKNNVP